MEAPKADSKAAPGDGEAASTPVASQHITKGRFKVKHIKSDENITASSPTPTPQMIVRTSSNDGNTPAAESGAPVALASDEKEKEKDKAAVAPKKSRFIVKTKTAKEDDRSDSSHDGCGSSSPALRLPQSGSAAPMSQGPGLVRVPSGTNLSLLRQPSTGQQPSRSLANPKEENMDKIYHMLEMNNRILREIMGDVSFGHTEGHMMAHPSVLAEHGSGSSNSNGVSPDFAHVQSTHPPPSWHIGQSAPVDSGQSPHMQRPGSSGVSTSSQSGGVASIAANGDKSMAKLAHHATEIRKEVENATKARRDSNIEIQRLREKCQLLEEKVSQERSKAASLEERLEKSQMRQRSMAAQIESLQQALAASSTGKAYSGTDSFSGKDLMTSIPSVVSNTTTTSQSNRSPEQNGLVAVCNPPPVYSSTSQQAQQRHSLTLQTSSGFNDILNGNSSVQQLHSVMTSSNNTGSTAASKPHHSAQYSRS